MVYRNRCYKVKKVSVSAKSLTHTDTLGPKYFQSAEDMKPGERVLPGERATARAEILLCQQP